MLNKHAGFTLVESLLVIFIISLLLVITIPLSAKHIEKHRERKFFQVFNQDLLYVQNACMSSKGGYSLTTYTDYYEITDINNDRIRRDLPSDYKISKFKGMEEISFTDSGSIKRAGSLLLYTKNKSYNIILAPGKGRARYEQR